MKRNAAILGIVLLSLAFATIASAAERPVALVRGGGIAQNNNSGLGDLLAIGGFTALGMADGSARGQVQAKSAESADPTITTARLHGRVVCVQEIGETGVWEVRFEVVRADGTAAPLMDLGFPAHGSLFVFDGGSPGAGNDGIDESFEGTSLADPSCGLEAVLAEMSLEPVLAGNFSVRSRD